MASGRHPSQAETPVNHWRASGHRPALNSAASLPPRPPCAPLPHANHRHGGRRGGRWCPRRCCRRTDKCPARARQHIAHVVGQIAGRVVGHGGVLQDVGIRSRQTPYQPRAAGFSVACGSGQGGRKACALGGKRFRNVKVFPASAPASADCHASGRQPPRWHGDCLKAGRSGVSAISRHHPGAARHWRPGS